MFSTDKNNVDIEVKVLARHTQIGGQEEQQSNTVGRDYMSGHQNEPSYTLLFYSLAITIRSLATLALEKQPSARAVHRISQRRTLQRPPPQNN